MLRIENCQNLSLKDGLIFARGSTLFQGKISDIYFARYTVESNLLQLFYSEFEVQIPLTTSMTPESINSIFPTQFFKMHSPSFLHFYNFKMVSFVHMNGNHVILHFDNGTPVTITLENNVVETFAQMSNFQELLKY